MTVTAVRRVKVRGSASFHYAAAGSTLTICGRVAAGPAVLAVDRWKRLCARCAMTFRAANRDGDTLRIAP